MGVDLFTVRVALVEAFLDSAARGLPTSRVSPRRATYFSLLRQRNLRKRKATRLSVSLCFAAGNLRCSAKAGSRSNSPSAQTIASPDPLLPALLGPAKRAWGTHTDVGRRGRAKRALVGAQFRCPHPTPSGYAEERRSSRIRASDCLSVASSSSTPAGSSTTGCPAAQRRGRRQQGRLFFAYFLLAKQKKVSSRRATPGLQRRPQA